MAEKFYYILGVVVYTALAVFLINASLNVLPQLVFYLTIASPVLLYFIQKKDGGAKKWDVGGRFKKIVKNNMKRWKTLFVLAFIVGIAGDALALLVGKVLLSIFMGGVIAFFMWEVVRYVALKIKKVELPSYFEMIAVSK